jgi:hypothetical protein
MQLTSDMIRQMASRYTRALYSGPEHFKLIDDLRPSRAHAQPPHVFEWQTRIKEALASLCGDEKYYHDVGTADGGLGHDFAIKRSIDPSKWNASDPTCMDSPRSAPERSVHGARMRRVSA